jgi:tRNA (guanine37-N1)-methyltransferase
MDDSHYNGLLEYPQYTRPREFNGYSVPEILLSGDHQKIETWRKEEALRATSIKRPDLLKEKIFTKEEIDILSKIDGNFKN